MSRARSIALPSGEIVWFDVHRNGQKATAEQLDLVAAILDLELDELLDENLSQGEVISILRGALNQGTVPPDIEERRERARRERAEAPKCRICEREGDSTKHHFVNRWMLKELSDYSWKWADRRNNCIPVCISCHRDLHLRNDGPHPIVGFLTEAERAFAQRALDALSNEHPAILVLVAKGSDETYETRLVRDYLYGKFLS